MKKLTIILGLVLASTIVFGQKRMTQTAINYLRNGKLDKAMEAINTAIEHEKTMNDAKTWFYRGGIYVEIGITDKEEYKSLAEDPLMESYKSYKKAMEYDEDGEYSKDIKQNMQYIAQQFYNDAANAYNDRNYVDAAQNFMTSYKVYEAVGINDTTSLLNYATSSQLAGNSEAAMQTYEKLMDMGYEDAALYESLANIYREEGDFEKAEEILQEGREKYPESYPILLAEINLFMSSGQNEKAISSLQKATEKDPENYTIWFALGDMYDKFAADTSLTEEARSEYFNRAEKAYKTAIDVKEDYFDAYFNMGALYVNKAAEIQQIANDLPLEAVEEYDKLKAKADDLLAKALPYLESAYEIKTDDRATMLSLKEIYTRLGQLDKAKEINMKLQQQ
ncbi:MAG: tetratricopeptide repeat protein [Bacteroidales bacterium]|nr:tetratricopeptide repeat protein [Bacteroidales bacterium]MCF8388062.1 tetratricopeptide repeat protein [Bacteroidales bacterium]MCF8398881.1 tetratricopeptide repeat protein [Bacteroidales bacterium]